jgi:large subunit ribosomal protein L22
MEIKAKGKYLKISPKKARLVIDLIRNKDASEALDYLKFIPKKASHLIAKVLKSAISNAEHNFNLKKENLFIKEIFINQGPVLKRWRARAFGRAAEIRKKSSHLEIILKEKVPSPKIKSIKQKQEKPVLEENLEIKSKEEIHDQEISHFSEKEKKQGKIKNKKTGALKKIFRRKSI